MSQKENAFGAENIIWDLSDLFTSLTDPEIKNVMTTSLKKATDFEKKYKTKVDMLSAKQLRDSYKQLEELLVPLYKLSQYSSLRYSIETQNEDIKQLVGKLDDLESEISNKLLFFDLELGNLSKKAIADFKSSDELKNYYYSILRSHQTAQFNLAEEEEKVINIKDVTGMNGYQKLYSELTASFRFNIKLDGKTKELTGPEIRNLRLHKDPKVRAKAMKIFFDKYKENKIVVTHILNHIFKDFNTERKLRGYKSPISVRNISNNLPENVIEMLHDVTTKSNKLVQKYYKIKKKLLKLDKMSLADIYAPLPNVETSFSYDEAKKIVLDGFYVFDTEFGDIAKKMFDENRIHAPVQKQKRGGAFCSGYTPDVYPYVMLNYLGKPRDVSTMAHELGHAIHDVLASKQTLTNYHPILPLAETASVFAEMVVTDKLKKELTDDQSKIVLLCEKLEDIFATSHRQNMFSEFEKAAHGKISDTLLSTDELCEIYKKGLKSMFGDAVTITKEYEYEWATIPHFLDYPFYVYAYNFGNLLVLALYQVYLEQGDSFIPKLKEVLSSGSAMSPVEITKLVGVDIASREFWEKSIVYIQSMIDELEALV